MLRVVGIFVGGKGRRMGGLTKGLLPSPDGPSIIERSVDVCRRALTDVPIVLVGDHPGYEHLDCERVPDAPGGIGPLGGLRALLTRAEGGAAIAIACDMPFFQADLLQRLARHAPRAPALAPKLDARWQPLFARYSGAAIQVIDGLIAEKKHALFGVLDGLATEEFVLSPSEHTLLRDWDAPEDMT